MMPIRLNVILMTLSLSCFALACGDASLEVKKKDKEWNVNIEGQDNNNGKVTIEDPNNPKDPPKDPPVDPPKDPPVDPPKDPPVDPPVDPPKDPPVDPPVTQGECPRAQYPDECEVFDLVNEERAKVGASALKYDIKLADAARLHAVDMVMQNYFSHSSKDGRNFSTRAKQAGYTAFPSGENIAAGQRSPAQVMNSWMNSSGHKRNILSTGSNEIGVGLHNYYWVQVFGKR